MALTMSMMRAMEILNTSKNEICLQDLQFVLTVFRDNAKDDDVYELLDKIVKESF